MQAATLTDLRPARSVHISTDGSVLVLVGDLDVRSTSEVRAAVHEHVLLHGSGGERRVVLDLSGVTSVDETALKVLAAASRRARLRGTGMVLRGASPAVRRMLHLTHLIRLVEVEREPVPA